MATSNATGGTVVRRCANYKPTVWTDDYIQSLQSKYLEQEYVVRRDQLKEDVKVMLTKLVSPLDQLRSVDVLQRLSLGYHFDDQIRTILDNFHHKNYEGEAEMKRDLFATALQFRLLRQNGYNASVEVFSDFKDDICNTDEIGSANLTDDVDAMLALHEASFLSTESETILSDARDFASKQLKRYVEKIKDDRNDVKACLSKHALEIPLHHRMQRLEARWFIDVYERMDDMNPILLELAKLDFNIIQAIHQEEIKEISRWWKESNLAKKLGFARHRVMESFLWTMGLRFEPIHRQFRLMMAKLALLGAMMDDIYDVHGTVDELELFTSAIESWNLDSVDLLPDYLKIFFLAFYNFVNETVYYILKEQGFFVLKYMKMACIDLCKSYLREAKWLQSGYNSTSLEEYIENGWHSIGLQLAAYQAYFTIVVHPLTHNILSCLEEFPSIVFHSSMVFRLVDDIGTFRRERQQGDISNAVYRYMQENRGSEKEALEHLKLLADKYWKKMNEDLIGGSSLPHILNETTINFSRIAVMEYQHGDGYTIQNKWNINLTKTLFINHIPMS